MASEEAARFYKSMAWRNCRDAFIKSKGGLCERCLKKGLYIPGEIVHHRVYISPDNIDDPGILLNWNNLELLCRKCHALEHDSRKRRYTIDAYGRVSPLQT